MKKVFLTFVVFLFLTGCFQMIALVPAVVTGVTTGNALQATISYGINYGVKEATGMTPIEHALSYTIQNDKMVIEGLNKDLTSAFVPIDIAID